MIIEIDDAGWGCPIGGVIIGGLKNSRFSYRVIPLEIFREHDLRKNELPKAVLAAVKDLLKDLKYNPEEDLIHICRGSIFSSTRAWLTEMNYNWEPWKIVSKLQDLVEGAMDLHLISLGVPRMLLKRLLNYIHYSLRLYQWVILDKKNREKIVKTDFPAWKNVWSSTKLLFKKGIIKRGTYCLNCGEKLTKGDIAYQVIFQTPKKQYKAWIHQDCREKLD